MAQGDLRVIDKKEGYMKISSDLNDVKKICKLIDRILRRTNLLQETLETHKLDMYVQAIRSLEKRYSLWGGPSEFSRQNTTERQEQMKPFVGWLVEMDKIDGSPEMEMAEDQKASAVDQLIRSKTEIGDIDPPLDSNLRLATHNLNEALKTLNHIWMDQAMEPKSVENRLNSNRNQIVQGRNLKLTHDQEMNLRKRGSNHKEQVLLKIVADYIENPDEVDPFEIFALEKRT